MFDVQYNKFRKKETDLEERMTEVSLLLRAQKRPEPGPQCFFTHFSCHFLLAALENPEAESVLVTDKKKGKFTGRRVICM
jgi:hypothetical protein